MFKDDILDLTDNNCASLYEDKGRTMLCLLSFNQVVRIFMLGVRTTLNGRKMVKCSRQRDLDMDHTMIYYALNSLKNAVGHMTG